MNLESVGQIDSSLLAAPRSYNINARNAATTSQSASIPKDEVPVIGYIRNGINSKFVDACNSSKDLIKDQYTFNIDNELFPNSGWSSFQKATLLHIAAFYNNPFALRFILDVPEIDVDVKTSEGLTALHIACRLGNVLATDLLLLKNANYSLEDTHGRQPMHYAVMSKKLAVVLLLLRRPDVDLSKLDADKNSAQNYAEDNDMISLLDEVLEDRLDYMWAPMNLNMHVCCNPVLGKRNNGVEYCRCGQLFDIHDDEFFNLSQEKDWNPTRDMRILPSNAFGEIEFSGLSQTAKFVRLSHETKENIIHSLFQNHWNLPQPSMVICIYGNDCNSISLKSVISKGIWKSVGQSNAWIITNGVNMDVVNLVGEAVRDYCDAYGNETIMSLGVVPWNILLHRDVLISTDYGGSYPSIYPVQKANFDEISLNPNCTHFMMVDTNTTSMFGAECNFRGLVENCSSSWKIWTETESRTKPIPTCGMLIAGDRSSLREVSYSVARNNCPLVILKGTGGLADILSEVIEEKTKSAKTFSNETIRNSMLTNWLLTEDDLPDDEEIQLVKSIIRKEHIIEIFSIEDSSSNDLDGKILSALLSSASMESFDNTQINTGQLQIALTLNRSDVAKSKVFSDQKIWKRGELDEYFFTALIDTKVGFVKLFIEQGFRLEKFVTPRLLERLYNEDLKLETDTKILRRVLTNLNIRKKWITLQHIGKAISTLIEAYYKPLYLKDTFIVKCKKYANDPVDRPARELFIWSLLTQRIEMSAFFWTLQRDSMASGLLAAILLREMSLRSSEVIDQEELTEAADKFEDRATGVLDECYNEDQEKAMDSLTRQLTYFGDSTCLILAAEGNSIKFIAHRCCLELLKNIWFGGLDRATPFHKFFFAIIIGIIPTPLVAFIMDYEEDTKRMVKASQDSYDHTATKTSAKRRQLRANCDTMWQRMRLFYCCPLVKFLYSTCSYFLFLLLFSYILLFRLVGDISVWHGICFLMFMGLVFEELRQVFKSGTSLSSYLGDLWNKLDVVAITLFIIGATIYASIYNDYVFNNLFLQIRVTNIYYADRQTLIHISRIALAISLFIYYTRLLQVFSININLGPKVLMIFRMISDDLIPFMIIFLIFVVAYGVLLYGITFPLAPPTATRLVEQIYDMMRTAYFESFGELRLDYLTNSASSCTAGSNCPDYVGRWASLIFVGIYLLITNVLLLNMLIAMFSHTYESVQVLAVQYWTIQRYSIIKEYTERSIPPPPFNIIWILITLPFNIYFRCMRPKQEIEEGPFLLRYDTNRLRERQLIQWERLRVLDYLRSLEDGSKKKKKHDAAVYVNRTSILSGNSVNVKKELSDVRDELGDKFKESLKDVESQLLRLDAIEEHMISLHDAIAALARTMGSQQHELIERLQRQQEKKEKKGKRPDSMKVASVPRMNQPPRPETVMNDETSRYPSDSHLQTDILDAEERSEDLHNMRNSENKSGLEEPSLSDNHSTILDIGEADQQSSVDFSYHAKSQPVLEEISMSVGTPSEIEPYLWESSSKVHQFSRIVPYTADTTSRAAKVITDWRRLALDYKPTEILMSLFHEAKWADPPSTKDFSFNAWDQKFKVNRITASGSYLIKDNLPLNPLGRQGVAHRGHLPFWGPNHVVHLLFTRWRRDEKDAIERRDGKMILQCLIVQIQRLFQLPWYYVQHQRTCDFESCIYEAVKSFLQERAQSLHESGVIDERNFESISMSIAKIEPTVVFRGIMDDYVNADNAWIETVAINCHELYSHSSSDVLIHILQHGDPSEKVCWVDMFNRRLMRGSHTQLCEATAAYHNSAF